MKGTSDIAYRLYIYYDCTSRGHKRRFLLNFRSYDGGIRGSKLPTKSVNIMARKVIAYLLQLEVG